MRKVFAKMVPKKLLHHDNVPPHTALSVLTPYHIYDLQIFLPFCTLPRNNLLEIVPYLEIQKLAEKQIQFDLTIQRGKSSLLSQAHWNIYFIFFYI